MDFNSWIVSIRELLHKNNGPLKLKNGHWEVTDRVNLWIKFGSRIFDVHLDLIKDCAITVLSEIDPQFELPTKERYAASIHGKILEYSSDIRKGLAETLALIGTYGDKLINCSQHKPDYITALSIRELFKNANWQRWASLNYLLPTLAEASPDDFLDAIENTLLQIPCPFDELFAQEGNGITGGNYMTGLLWALENLAWCEDFLARVLLILAELATHDPGGNWVNRPANSLTTILLPWHPQTLASVDKRINAIKAVQKEFPDIAWKTLLNLLPNQHQVSHGSHKPTFRKYIPDDWELKVTNIEYWNQVEEYSDLVVQMAQKNIESLIQLVNNLDNLPAPSLSVFLEFLSSDNIISLPEDTRQPIWETLNALVNKHRRFAKTKWALDPEIVDNIENIAKKLAPMKPQNLYRQLFSHSDMDLYDENGDWSVQQKKLEENRQDVLQTILNNEGFDAVIQFSEIVENSSKVGWSLGHTEDKELDKYLLPHFFDKKEEKYRQFIGSFIFGRFNKNGIEWANNLNREFWTNDQSCQLLIYLPFDTETWLLAEKWLGEFEPLYWKKVNANPYQAQSSLFPAIDKLLEVNRPFIAIDCLYAHFLSKKEFDKERAIKALLLGISFTEPTTSMDTHNITEIIKILQNDKTINADDLFKIEWGYLPLLNRLNGIEPIYLEKCLSFQPGFFCEVIQLLYRSIKDEKKQVEPNEKKEALTNNAWQLLHDWRRPPGLNDGGSLSRDKLLEWLKKVKENCNESGHLDVAMIHVGHVLFYAPSDPDGLWIHKAVAEVLNDKESENIRNGFSTEIFNSRGVHWIDPSGKPEQELAEQWRQRATEVENDGYVRFASILKEVARSYDREAERVISDYKNKELSKNDVEDSSV